MNESTSVPSTPDGRANLLGLPGLWIDKTVTLSILITSSGGVSVLAKVDEELMGTKPVPTPTLDLLPAPLRDMLAQIAAEAPERKHAAEVERALADARSAAKTAKSAAAKTPTPASGKPAPGKPAPGQAAASKPDPVKPANAASVGKAAATKVSEAQPSFFDSF